MSLFLRRLFLFLVIAATAYGDDPPGRDGLSINEIAGEVLAANLELVKIRRALEEARDALKGEKSLENSTFSVAGGYSYAGEGEHNFSGSTGATLPLFPQAIVGGTVEVNPDGSFEESLSLTVKPFEKRDPLYPAEQNYASLLVRLDYLRRRLYTETERSVFDLLIRQMEQRASRETLQLEEKKYELVQRQQERGTASFHDVQTQLVSLSEARQDLFNTELQLLSDRNTLALLLAPREDEIIPATITLDQLLGMVEFRRGEVDRAAGSKPSSEKLEILELEAASLETELKATPVWTPGLDLSARVGLPEATFTLGAELSFSPKQVRKDEQERVLTDIEENKLDIQAERFGLDLKIDLLKQRIMISEQALSASLLQMEKDTLTLEEAEILFQQGRRTSLELAQMELNVKRDEIRCFRAASDLLAVQAEYLLLVNGLSGEIR